MLTPDLLVPRTSPPWSSPRRASVPTGAARPCPSVTEVTCLCFFPDTPSGSYFFCTISSILRGSLLPLTGHQWPLLGQGSSFLVPNSGPELPCGCHSWVPITLHRISDTLGMTHPPGGVPISIPVIPQLSPPRPLLDLRPAKTGRWPWPLAVWRRAACRTLATVFGLNRGFPASGPQDLGPLNPQLLSFIDRDRIHTLLIYTHCECPGVGCPVRACHHFSCYHY